jgi:hypothetical protein
MEKASVAGEKPAGAVALIVAELVVDDCATKTVALAWSTHNRDLFAEMRKAAARFPETANLAKTGREAEHREKYSMGAGYYLKAEGTYDTGWRVRKTSRHMDELAAA